MMALALQGALALCCHLLSAVMPDNALGRSSFLEQKPVFDLYSLYNCLQQKYLYTVPVQLRFVFLLTKLCKSLCFAIVANEVYRYTVHLYCTAQYKCSSLSDKHVCTTIAISINSTNMNRKRLFQFQAFC